MWLKTQSGNTLNANTEKTERNTVFRAGETKFNPKLSDDCTCFFFWGKCVNTSDEWILFYQPEWGGRVSIVMVSCASDQKIG